MTLSQHRKTYNPWRDLAGLVRRRRRAAHRDEPDASAPDLTASTSQAA